MGHISENLSEVADNFVSQPKGISTGFDSLDNAIWGFSPRTLVMIGGRPGTGKSSLMADLILATSKEVPVGVFSKEMPLQQLPPRLACNMANLNYHNVRKGDVSKMELDTYHSAMEELKTLPIQVDYESNIVGSEDFWLKVCKESEPNIESKVIDFTLKKWVAEQGCKVIFIDYLQILDLLNKSVKDQRLKIGRIAELLRDYAKLYNITIVLLSQLRRFDPSKGKSPLPSMSDLKESGELEAHSDIILLLYRPEFSEDRELDLYTDKVEDDALIILSKNRDGPAGNIKVNFNAFSMSYRDKSDVEKVRF